MSGYRWRVRLEDEIPVLQWFFPGRKKNEGFWDTVAYYSLESKVIGLKDGDMRKSPLEELEQAEEEAERLLSELASQEAEKPGEEEEQKEQPAEKPAKKLHQYNN